MVSSVTAAISGSGIGREQIHADPFHVTGQDAAAETTGRAQAGNVGRLLEGVRGLLAVGRLRHPKNPGPLSPAKILREPLADETPPQAANSSGGRRRSEEHTSELQSLMRNSYAVFCLQKKT